MVGLNALAMDAYLPAIAEMALELAVPVQIIEHSVPMYMLGYTLGLLGAAPFSDRLGRKPICTTGVVLYMLCSLGAALVQSAALLGALRVLQGIGAGICLVNVGAIVRDLYDEHDSARQLSRITLLLMALPLVAPFGGAFVLNIASWRWIFVALAFYGFVVLLAIWQFLPETGRRRGRTSPDQGPLSFLISHVLSVLAHRRATFFALTAALSVANLFLFLSDAAFVYLKHFGVSTTRFPVYFGANVVLMAAMHFLNLRLLKSFKPRAIMPVGLWLTLTAAVWACVYSVAFEPTLGVTVLNTALVMAMQTLVVNNAQAAYMSRFDENAGMANALIGGLIFAVGAGAGLVLGALHNNHPSALTTAWVVVSVLALVCARIALRER